ncbi:hypothetical protein HELRODRAFT_87243, partial [Helobdella robusta]|uniref:VWF/SSPO/Zonadhesin-like cysteine-rich domain-containing protein n=1 Tax=Helobdella robusta TaxID=6412 RepID=T1G6N4_HELRO
WAISSCSIITNGEVFKECRSLVDYKSYYDECLSAACSCETGGDCACLCTIVESFAVACNKQGSCPKWRSNYFCRQFIAFFEEICINFNLILNFLKKLA